MISRPRATTSSRSLKKLITQSNLETITPNLTQVVLNNYAQQAAVGGSLDTRNNCRSPGHLAAPQNPRAGMLAAVDGGVGVGDAPLVILLTLSSEASAQGRSRSAGRRCSPFAAVSRSLLAEAEGLRPALSSVQRCSRVIYPRSIFLWLYLSLDELLLSDHVALSRGLSFDGVDTISFWRAAAPVCCVF
jgi:hypothetical protein